MKKFNFFQPEKPHETSSEPSSKTPRTYFKTTVRWIGERYVPIFFINFCVQIILAVFLAFIRISPDHPINACIMVIAEYVNWIALLCFLVAMVEGISINWNDPDARDYTLALSTIKSFRTATGGTICIMLLRIVEHLTGPYFGVPAVCKWIANLPMITANDIWIFRTCLAVITAGVFLWGSKQYFQLKYPPSGAL